MPEALQTPTPDYRTTAIASWSRVKTRQDTSAWAVVFCFQHVHTIHNHVLIQDSENTQRSQEVGKYNERRYIPREKFFSSIKNTCDYLPNAMLTCSYPGFRRHLQLANDRLEQLRDQLSSISLEEPVSVFPTTRWRIACVCFMSVCCNRMLLVLVH